MHENCSNSGEIGSNRDGSCCTEATLGPKIFTCPKTEDSSGRAVTAFVSVDHMNFILLVTLGVGTIKGRIAVDPIELGKGIFADYHASCASVGSIIVGSVLIIIT